MARSRFMLNDPPPDTHPHQPIEEKPVAPEPTEPQRPKRRPHPLELPPASREQNVQGRQQARLHIPSVVPRVTYALVIINVVLYVIGYLFQNIGDELLNGGALNSERVLLFGEYHRLVTSMFLHASIPHILFNALVLYSFGSSLERIIGHVRFLLIYMLGGLGGSVLTLVLEGEANVWSVGASGAIFALIGAEYVFLYKHRKLFGASGQARRRNLIVISLMNIAVGFFSNSVGGEVPIANWGHVGGLIGGLVLAWFISPDFILRRHPDYKDEAAFIAEDTNPLNKKYWAVSLYSAGLMVILISAAVIVRR